MRCKFARRRAGQGLRLGSPLLSLPSGPSRRHARLDSTELSCNGNATHSHATAHVMGPYRRPPSASAILTTKSRYFADGPPASATMFVARCVCAALSLLPCSRFIGPQLMSSMLVHLHMSKYPKPAPLAPGPISCQLGTSRCWRISVSTPPGLRLPFLLNPANNRSTPGEIFVLLSHKYCAFALVCEGIGDSIYRCIADLVIRAHLTGPRTPAPTTARRRRNSKQHGRDGYCWCRPSQMASEWHSGSLQRVLSHGPVHLRSAG